MKRWACPLVVLGGLILAASRLPAEIPAVELTTLVRKVHAAVMLVLVSDDSGRAIASGTGFIVRSDGWLVTNRHVANAGPHAFARTAGGRPHPVLGVLAEDDDHDLVLLQIDGRDLPPLTLGASRQLAAGVPVIMFGNPLREVGTAMEGTVSGFREFAGARRWIEITAAFASGQRELTPKVVHGDGLQVVTPVAHGASGSPVLDREGTVVGVVTAVQSDQGQLTTLAIPVEAVKALLQRAAQAPAPKPLGELTRRGWNDLSTDREFGAAVLAFQAGDLDGAETHAKNVVSRFPDSPVAYQFLGNTQLRRKSYREAADSFERALRLKPGLAAARAGLAMAYAGQGLIDRARDAVRDLEKTDPDLARKVTASLPALGR